MIAALGTLARPFLARLDPETAHALTVGALRHLPAAPAPADDPRLLVSAFGLAFPNPVGLAAGFDKEAAVPDALLALGFGFVEVGTLTPKAQPGNPRPRAFRLPRDRALINRYGFNNGGHAAGHARLLARRGRGGVVGVNIGANKDADDRVGDYAAGVAAFADVASYLTVNVSSPNTPGLRDLQEAAALDDLLARVLEARDAASARAGRRVPVLLKIAPDLDEPALDAIVRVACRREIDGMVVANTTVSRPAALRDPAQARQAGGLSGRPLFEPSTRMLALTFQRVGGRFPLIGVGGIEDGESAFAKVAAGATLLQLYTGLVFAGPRLVPAVKRGLLTALERERTTLAAAVGRDAARFARS